MGAEHVLVAYDLRDILGFPLALWDPIPETFGDLLNKAIHFRDDPSRTIREPIDAMGDEEIWQIIGRVVADVLSPYEMPISREMRINDLLSSL